MGAAAGGGGPPGGGGGGAELGDHGGLTARGLTGVLDPMQPLLGGGAGSM